MTVRDSSTEDQSPGNLAGEIPAVRLPSEPPNSARELFAFAWKTRRIHMITSVVVFLLMFGLGAARYARDASGGSLTSFLLDWVFWEPVLGVTTLTVAVFVWIGELTQDFERRLPKRVSVFFLYPVNQQNNGKNRKIAMLCKYAILDDVSNIRGWSQQIGSQMLGLRQLQFDLSFHISPSRRELSPDTLERIIHYRITFLLTELPQRMDNPVFQTHLEAGHCLVWDYGYEGASRRQWYAAGELVEVDEIAVERLVPLPEPVPSDAKDALMPASNA